MTEPTRYPLAWPAGRPRRSARQRIGGSFSMTVGAAESPTGTKARKVNLSTAVDRLEDQVKRLGGVYPLLSTNVEPRLDGRPAGGRAQPADPAVCVYFSLKGAPYALACDTYTEVEQNIAALAAHIEATRRIARYGVATAEETLQAFSALPPPAAQPPPRPVWWVALDFPSAGVEPPRGSVDADLIGFLYRKKVKTVAGDEEKLKALNLAKDDAMAWLGQKALTV